MKTFQQFCEQVYQLDEFQIANPLQNPLVKKVTQNPMVKQGFKWATRAGGALTALDSKESPGSRVVGAMTVVKPFNPVTLGASVAVPAALEIAKQRRAAQQARYTSLIPSGKTDVSGKPAQIKPLNR